MEGLLSNINVARNPIKRGLPADSRKRGVGSQLEGLGKLRWGLGSQGGADAVIMVCTDTTTLRCIIQYTLYTLNTLCIVH